MTCTRFPKAVTPHQGLASCCAALRRRASSLVRQIRSPTHLSDGFGQLPFGHGDPLANQLDRFFLIGFVCKEIPHDSRFSLGIESRDPDVPSCRHSWQYAPPRPPVNGPCRFRILKLLQPPSTEPPRLPSRVGKIRSPIQKISSPRFRSAGKIGRGDGAAR